MLTKLYGISQKNIFLSFVIKIVVFICMKIISARDELTATLRVKFPQKSKYKELLQYKNRYLGERCFIICTGPSLSIEDLNKLRNEYTFGMNSICLLANKTNFRPTFYGCIDEGVYKKLKNDMEEFCGSQTTMFVSNRIAKYRDCPLGWKVIPVNVAYHTYDRWFKNKFWCKFSDDCFRLTYDMFSVTHVLIQLAVYMGFKEIYLIGADCNQIKGKQLHFKDYGVFDATIDTARERNIVGFEEVKRYSDSHGFKVYNATRGGMLDVFDRVDLDNILKV